MKNNYHKKFITAIALFAGISACGIAFSATVEITNNIAPIQIGATIYDNGGNPGNPTINIWAPGASGSGVTIAPSETYTYPTAVINGASATFGVQVNSGRIPSGGGRCDQLCNHIQVTISQDGQTCAASNTTSGSCGANPNAPRWTADLSASMSNGVCSVNLKKATTPPIVCSCKDGQYPCDKSVQCGTGSAHPTCHPVQLPPYQW